MFASTGVETTLPDLKDRTAREKSLAEIIEELFAKQQSTIKPLIVRDPPKDLDDEHWAAYWLAMTMGLTIVLYRPFASLHVNARRAIERKFGLDIDTAAADRASLDWASRKASGEAHLIVDTIRRRLLKGWEVGSIFSPERAKAIAVTETTIAHTAGEVAGINSAKQQHPTIMAYWQTSEDEKVCPICDPLNDKPEYLWAHRLPMGPPAHVNCRCFLDWRE